MIEPLSQEEITKLEGQHVKVARMLAEIDRALYEIGFEIEEKERMAGGARIELEIAKTKKSVLVERARNLKTILGVPEGDGKVLMKTTKKEVQDRVNFIIAEIAKGTRPVMICQNETVKTWGVDERQVWRYIGKAYTYFEKEANINRDKELGKILERYEFLYNQAVAYAAETKDFGTAAGILDKRAELIGLNKIVIAGDKDSPVTVKWATTANGSDT